MATHSLADSTAPSPRSLTAGRPVGPLAVLMQILGVVLFMCVALGTLVALAFLVALIRYG